MAVRPFKARVNNSVEYAASRTAMLAYQTGINA